jgi:hypothetical protein
VEIDWLLNCDPRPAQLEALRRSYRGYKFKEHRDDPGELRPLPWAGRPANGYGHFMEMRTGKTPTALNEFMLFKRDWGVNKMLVLAPNRFKPNWGIEADKFGIDVPVCVFHSHDREDAERFVRASTEGVLVANYEALSYAKSMAIFTDWVDDKTYMAADESVAMKNPQSWNFKNSMLLGKQAAVTRALTGLPAPQGVTDLWAQLRFTRKLSSKNLYAFRARYATMGGYKNRKITGRKNVEELEELLDQWAFRARLADWADTLDSDYELIEVEMLDKQRRAYAEMERDFMAWLASGEMVSVESAITKHMKLSQISSGFIYDENKNPQEIAPFHKTPKFEDLRERLALTQNKTIVFAHHRYVVQKLYEHLKAYNPAVIAGGVDMKKWGLDPVQEAKRFNENPACRLMIGQSQAIKYGWTLMGAQTDPCLTSVFYENSYSLDTREQCEARNKGHGQTGPIHVVDYWSSPVEKKIIGALRDKKNVSDAIMGYYRHGGC